MRKSLGRIAIMERLHLLKPDVVSGYLNEGNGQEVTYLHINYVIDL